MATDAQRARRRAQRERDKALREKRKLLPPSVTRPAKRAREDYIDHLRAHPEDITPADLNELARRASYAEWERRKPGSHPRANPRDEYDWGQFFYHKDR